MYVEIGLSVSSVLIVRINVIFYLQQLKEVWDCISLQRSLPMNNVGPDDDSCEEKLTDSRR